ncbi:MAG: site-2 protease family protein [Actinomycetota bacterium]
MNPTLSLGRIAGIRIGVNWSWIAALALIVWSLGAEVFPAQNPGLGDGTYAAMAVTAAVLFFTTLLLHELGHALQARREGMRIEGITLWLFGGVARFRGAFPSAGAELRVAAAGPAVTVAIAAALLAVAAAASPTPAVDGVVAWLGYVNLLLLAFNLLPALPLDGGRILLALLWRRSGDVGRATRTAAGFGRGLGWVMIAGGLVLVALGAAGGIWLAALGWFLHAAATAEARQGRVRDALRGRMVRDEMTPVTAVAAAGQTLRSFADALPLGLLHTAYPVVDDGRVLGLLPVDAVADVPTADWDRRLVRDLTVPRDRLAVLRPEEDLFEALLDMGAHGQGRALVMDGDRLRGLVSVTDIERLLDPSLRRPPSARR